MLKCWGSPYGWICLSLLGSWKNPEDMYKCLGEYSYYCFWKLPSEDENHNMICRVFYFSSFFWSYRMKIRILVWLFFGLFWDCRETRKTCINAWVNSSRKFFQVTIRNSASPCGLSGFPWLVWNDPTVKTCVKNMCLTFVWFKKQPRE